jgi:hypothetical protein
MTPGPGFDLAVALLFAVPGPTNALVAIGGARGGARASGPGGRRLAG